VRLDQRSPSLGLFLLALALGAFLSPPAILAADYENGLAPPGRSPGSLPTFGGTRCRAIKRAKAAMSRL
jgi:hypothetical protein